jgi:hypothetical protein
MCNPLLIAAGAAAVVGGVRSYTEKKRAADEEAEALDYEGKVERDNALAESELIQRQGRSDRSASVASAAAAGVKIGEGSTLDVERRIMEDTEIDAALTIMNGERRARGLEANAFKSRRAGREQAYKSAIEIGSSLLSIGSKGMGGAGGA